MDDYGDDRADDDDGAAEPLLVTPAPILHKEARVVSFVFTPPAAYGHEDAAAFERAFSARHGLTDGVPPMIATTEDDDVAATGPDEVAKLYTKPSFVVHSGPGHRPLPRDREDSEALVKQLREFIQRHCPR